MWYRKAHSTPRRSKSARLAERFRPRLELLEDRQVPAVFTVSGTAGDDTFEFTPGTSNHVNVSRNGLPAGSFITSNTNSVVINGQGGSDSVTIHGSAGDNMFVVTAAGVTVDGLPYIGNGIGAWSFNGEGGSNTLIGPNTSNTWHFQDPDVGLLNDRLGFTGFKTLTGGTGGDYFYFAVDVKVFGNSGDESTEMGRFTGTIDGGGGYNAFDLFTNSAFSGYGRSTINLEDARVNLPIVGGAIGVGHFRNICQIDTVLGSTLIGRDQNATWDVTNPGAGKVQYVDSTMSFSGMQTLVGGTVQDTFNVTACGPGGLSLDGKAGDDTYDITFGNLAGPVTVVDSGPATETNTLIVRGPSNPSINNNFSKNQTIVVWVGEDQNGDPILGPEVVTYSGIKPKDIYGGNGQNLFDDPGGETTIYGGPQDNTFVISATSGSGVVLNGGPAANTYVVYMGDLGGPVTINSTAGSSTLTVVAPPGSNELTLTSNRLTGAGETVNLNLGTTATSITVDGSAGDNQLVLAGSPPGPVTAQSIPVTVAPAPPSSLSGLVWEDFNDDGQVDFGERGIAGVAVRLTGTDDLGNPVNISQSTDADGAYVFLGLRPGSYRITETQPAGYLQGTDSVGTAGGSLAGTDQFLVPLGPGTAGLNYNFGERPTAGGSVHHGQTAGIGFWNNKNGQALISRFNGGAGPSWPTGSRRPCPTCSASTPGQQSDRQEQRLRCRSVPAGLPAQGREAGRPGAGDRSVRLRDQRDIGFHRRGHQVRFHGRRQWRRHGCGQRRQQRRRLRRGQQHDDDHHGPALGHRRPIHQRRPLRRQHGQAEHGQRRVQCREPGRRHLRAGGKTVGPAGDRKPVGPICFSRGIAEVSFGRPPGRRCSEAAPSLCPSQSPSVRRVIPARSGPIPKTTVPSTAERRLSIPCASGRARSGSPPPCSRRRSRSAPASGSPARRHRWP